MNSKADGLKIVAFLELTFLQRSGAVDRHLFDRQHGGVALVGVSFTTLAKHRWRCD